MTRTQSDVPIQQRTLVIGGHERTYSVVGRSHDVPPVRILLAVHGSNQTGDGFRRMTGSGLDRWAQDGSGLVIYPDSWRRSLWNDARLSTPSRARAAGIDDVAFLRALVEEVAPAGTLVFGVGYSNGGQLIARALLTDPQLLDGAALFSATLAAEGNLVPQAAPRPVPVLMTHGSKDPLVPFEGGMATIFGFRPRGMMRSAADSARFWAHRNGIDAAPSATLLPHRGDSRTSTTRYVYAADGRPPVHFYATEGGGHVVPSPGGRSSRLLGRASTDLDAPAIALDFFGSTGPAPS